MPEILTGQSGVVVTLDRYGQPVEIQVLDALPDAVVVANRDGTVKYTNGQAKEFVYTGDSQAGSFTAELLFAEHDRREFLQMAERAFSLDQESDEAVSGELTVRRKDGSRLVAEIDILTMLLNGERIAVITIRDISRHKHVEHELRTSEMLLAEAQRVAQLGSWRWDLREDVVHWSEELFRLFGVEQSDEQISYQQYMEIIHPADRQRAQNTIREAVENRSTFEMEHRIVRPDGVVRLVYGQGAPGFSATGELVSMIGTAQDITERKANEAQAFQLALEQAARQEAERTKERFQLLAEVSEALSVSLEYEATLQKLMRLIIPRQADWCTINTQLSSGEISRVALAHRNPEKQLVLETIRDKGFIPHGDDSHPLTRALVNGKPQLYRNVTDEMLQKMARSSEHLALSRALNPTSVMLVPLVARGRAFGVLTFGMSDSGRRYAEDDLHLATEIAHRAAVSIDNSHLFQEAQEAARAREEFVSLVSHELKTPLTVIKGYIQVMERYLEQPDWEQDRIRTTRERLSTQVERLELLVSDILDVSRIQRGRLDLNVNPNTDLVHLASLVIDRFDDAIERRRDHELNLHADGPVVGCWDPLRLDQVFSNLLSNALKYSPDGGPINVSIRKDHDRAYLDVQDQGVGISEEEQRALFQPFQRGAAASRGISGTGLGLYITRQIVEQHGGQITVASAPGRSTTFQVSLPLRPEVCDHASEDHSSHS